MDIVIEWCQKWRLTLAENKTLVMHLGKNNPSIEYFAGPVKITKTSCARDLGISVDKELSFEDHINRIVNKAMHKCRMLLRSFRSSNPRFPTSGFQYVHSAYSRVRL
uniref:Reverse transcriptase domain-containing protein n=1 Tax=Caenorhabditis japonica TaxID=281687 RepID=A0A8R1IPF7_CAEJA